MNRQVAKAPGKIALNNREKNLGVLGVLAV
jgi:hypothetical protein